MQSDPGLFWGLIISMWIGNLILVVLNLPMIGVWVQLLRVPYRWLFPAILVFCCIGVYSINNNVWDVWIAIFFGFAVTFSVSSAVKPRHWFWALFWVR